MYAVAVVVEGVEDDIENGVSSYLPMAHIVERVTGHYQVPSLVEKCQPVLTQASCRHISAKCIRRCSSACHECSKRSTPASTLLSPPTPSDKKPQRPSPLPWKSRRPSALEPSPKSNATLGNSSAVAFSQVRALVGMDELKIAITGAAPIPTEIIEWFNAIGVNLTEIYGLSETTGPLTFSPKATSSASSDRSAWHGNQTQ